MRGLTINPFIFISGAFCSFLLLTALPINADEKNERIEGQTQTALGRIVNMEKNNIRVNSSAATWLRPGDEIEFISSGVVKHSANGEIILEMTEGWPDVELMATIVPLNPEPEPAPVAEKLHRQHSTNPTGN